MDNTERDSALFRAQIDDQLAAIQEQWQQADERLTVIAERMKTLRALLAVSLARQQDRIDRTDEFLLNRRTR